MRTGAHKSAAIFAGGITKIARSPRPRWQRRAAHPPVSSPIKNRGVEDSPDLHMTHSHCN